MGIVFFLLAVFKYILLFIVWLLAIVVLLVLAVLLLVLFMPIHYELDCEKQQKIRAEASVFCFFKQIYVRAVYVEKKLTYHVNVFFWSNEKKKRKKKRRLFLRRKKRRVKHKPVAEKPVDHEETMPIDVCVQPPETQQPAEEKITQQEEELRSAPVGEEKESNPKQKPKRKTKRAKKDTTQAHEADDGDEDDISMVDKIKNVLAYPDKDEIIRRTRLFIKRIYRDICPSVFAIQGVVGFDDPSLTGYLLGLLGIIQAMAPISINIKGNFEKKMLEGTIFVKGRLVLFFIVWHTALYVLSKPIWKLIKKWKDG